MAAVKGLDQLLKNLKRTPETLARRFVRQGVAKAARAVAREARAQARQESGLLKQSIGIKVKTYRNTGITVAVIGPRVGFKRIVFRPSSLWGKGRDVLSDPTKYAHLVEKGTGPSPARGGMTSRAFPFLGPSLRTLEAQVALAVAQSCERGLRSLGGAA